MIHAARLRAGSRALGPGFRRFRVAVLVGIGVVGLVGCGAHAAPRYGGLPKFLPTTSVPTDRVVIASAEHPQLATQGVSVRVDLPRGQVLATAVGPAVPPFVAPPPPAVTATFTVILVHASGVVPVSIGDFTIRNQLGVLVHPQPPVGASAPPSTTPVGGRVTLQLAAVLPTGEGQLQWAPAGGPVLVSWDFIVEND